MICSTCKKSYPSKYHFVTDSICLECFGKMPEAKKTKIMQEIESTTTERASKRMVNGKYLKCQICGHDRFWKRKTLLNTPGLTFLGVEWANKQADNFICDSCGYIFWFLRE